MSVERGPRQASVIGNFQVNWSVRVAAVAEVLLPRDYHRAHICKVQRGRSNPSFSVFIPFRNRRVEVVAVEYHPAVICGRGVDGTDVGREFARRRLNPRGASVGVVSVARCIYSLPDQTFAGVFRGPGADAVVAFETVGEIFVEQDCSTASLSDFQRRFAGATHGFSFCR